MKESIENRAIEIAKKNVNTAPVNFAGMKTTEIKSFISKYESQIAQALPKHLTAERLIQVCTTLIARNKDIAESTLESLIGAVLTEATLGLEPITALGYCYFVPYKNKQNGFKKEIQFVIGYAGMIDLAYRNEKTEMIYAHAVFENDLFEYCYGLNPDIKHIPAKNNRGERIIAAYAVAIMKGGGKAFRVLTEDELEAAKNSSPAGKSSISPWNGNKYQKAAMCCKTAIRRLFNYMPKSIELARAIQKDETTINLNDTGNIVEDTDYDIIDDNTNDYDNPDVPPSEYNQAIDSEGKLI